MACAWSWELFLDLSSNFCKGAALDADCFVDTGFPPFAMLVTDRFQRHLQCTCLGASICILLGCVFRGNMGDRMCNTRHNDHH
eukprot:4518650-Amphidinium_carterae.1